MHRSQSLRVAGCLGGLCFLRELPLPGWWSEAQQAQQAAAGVHEEEEVSGQALQGGTGGRGGAWQRRRQV